MPSDADPNDGVTIVPVPDYRGDGLGQPVPIYVDERQRSTTSCTPFDSDGVSICVGIGKPDARAEVSEPAG